MSLQRWPRTTDHSKVLPIRAARRYRWRLAGGRLTIDGTRLRFVPNRLERLRADTSWECAAGEVTDLRLSGRVWLVVETAGGAQTFRVFRAAAVLPRLEEALDSAMATAKGL